MTRKDVSPAEQRVLALVATGMTNKEIGHELGLSDSTVKVHIKSLLRQFHLHNRTQLAMHVLRAGENSNVPIAVLHMPDGRTYRLKDVRVVWSDDVGVNIEGNFVS